jgi:hypothetical protein
MFIFPLEIKGLEGTLPAIIFCINYKRGLGK